MWISMILVVFLLSKYEASNLAVIAGALLVMWFFNIVNKVRIKNKTK
jgi:hypothetical protein